MDELISFLKNKRNLINLLTLGIMVLGLPIATTLVRQQQVFKSRAAQATVEFLTKDRSGNDCVVNRNGKLVATCKDIVVRVYAPSDYMSSRLSESNDIVKKAYAYDAFCRNQPAPDSKGSEACWSHDGRQEWCDVVWDPEVGDACYWNCRTKVGCGEAEPAPAPPAPAPAPPAPTQDPCAGTPPGNGYSLDGCKSGTCGVEVWHCDADSSQKKDVSNSSGNCGSSQFNSACGSQTPPSGGGDFSCPDSANKIDDINKYGPYLVDQQEINQNLQPWKNGDGTCGYKYYVWVGPTNGTGSGKGYDTGPYCVANNYNFGAWSDQDACKASAIAKLGGTTPPTAGTGVSVGQGGCCSNTSDCKDGNTYQGQSTAGWTCDDTNPNCQGGKACKAPVGTQPTNTKCSAFLWDSGQWKNAVTVNAGDTIRVGALNADKSASNAILTLTLVKKTDGSTADTVEKKDLKMDEYYQPKEAGTYALSASGGDCDANSAKATLTVKALANPSSSPGGNPSSSSSAPKIIGYRLSETPTGFSGDYKTYSDSGAVTNFSFSNTNPEPKFIFVQFKDDKGNESKAPFLSASIDMLGPAPKVSNIYCYYDVKNDTVSVVVRGTDFGTTAGTVVVNNRNLSNDLIDGWEKTAVMSHINHPQSSASGTSLKVIVTKPDGQSDQGSCALNLTQFDIGATWMCNVANTHDIPNAVLSVYDTVPLSHSKASETVTISKEGTIKNPKTKLKEGDTYKICVYPPLGVRTCSDQFTFNPGTIVTKLNIPIGDINADGVINNSDAGLLRQQFGVGPNKTADFLQKGSVNSFDWGCMTQDFNKSNMPEPF